MGASVDEERMSAEPEVTRRRPWYRRRGLWWTVAVIAGFGGGYLYSVTLGCHTA